MTELKFKHAHELFSWAAHDFFVRAQKALITQAFFNVALSGGSTSQGFVEELAKEALNYNFLDKIRFFVSDERVVELSSPESNAGNAWRRLSNVLNNMQHNFFPAYNNIAYSAEEAAREYEDKLRELLVCDHNHIPVFDIIYLGIGLDGHTASLFPHDELVKNSRVDTRLVAATHTSIAGFRRITFMPKLINAAHSICVMATGEKKASVLDNIIAGPFNPEEIPAQLIMRDNHEKIVLLQSAS